MSPLLYKIQQKNQTITGNLKNKFTKSQIQRNNVHSINQYYTERTKNQFSDRNEESVLPSRNERNNQN